jgi:hypothetical protein
MPWRLAWAQPANDNFASATVITGSSGSVTGSNVNATAEVGEPSHAGSGAVRSAWWSWTPTSTASVTFTTLGSVFNTRLAIYTGTAVGSLTAVVSGASAGTGLIYSSVTFTAVSGTTYRIAVDGVFGTSGAITLNWTQSLPPDSGWWWNQAEPGRGFAIETRPATPLLTTPRLFIATFAYDSAGNPAWYMSQGVMSGNTSYSGPLNEFRDGQTINGSYRAPRMAGSIGTISLSFTSPTAGTLTWPGGTISIQRYPFVVGAAISAPVNGTGQTGWWWSGAEPGRGFFIEAQGSIMFLSGFMYESTGRPTWYVTQNTLTGATSFSGRLFEYGGGQPIVGAFRSPSTVLDRGTLSVSFSSTTAATVTLPNGTQVSLTRYNF